VGAQADVAQYGRVIVAAPIVLGVDELVFLPDRCLTILPVAIRAQLSIELRASVRVAQRLAREYCVLFVGKYELMTRSAATNARS
jgi:hypothetical protein